MRPLLDATHIAFDSLRVHKTRSALSMLSVIIGILAVASLLTVSLGIKSSVTDSINGLGSNLITVMSGKIDVGGIGGLGGQSVASTLTEDDFYALQEGLPEARNLSMAMLFLGSVKREDIAISSSKIFAATPGAQGALNLEIQSGRLNVWSDEEEGGRVAVIGSLARQTFFGNEEAVGEQITIRGEQFTVIGVLKDATYTPVGGSNINNIIMVPFSTGGELAETTQIFQIFMQAPDAGSTRALSARAQEILFAQHNGEDDFSVLTQDDFVGFAEDVIGLITAALAIFVSIVLFMGGMYIMQTMVMSVNERTSEIGIRKAVGATRRAILLQFLVESVLLTFSAGIVATTILFAAIATVSAHSPVPIEVTPFILGVSLGVSIVMGILFGLLPAYRASGKDPVEALRFG